MIRKIYIIIALLVAVAVCADENSQEKRILYLNSFQNSMAPGYQILQQCNKELSEKRLLMRALYEDLNMTFPESATLDAVKGKMDALVTRIQHEDFDVVVPFGQGAIDLLAAYGDAIPASTAIVACGMGVDCEKLFEVHHNTTSIVGESDSVKCLEMAMRLLPDTDRVILMSSSIAEGRKQREMLELQEKQYPELKFIYPDNSSMTINEVVDLVALQGRHTFVIFHSWYNRDTTNLLSLEYIKSRLSDVGASVFIVNDAYNWSGAVGGMASSTKQIGTELANAILDTIKRGNVCTGNNKQIPAEKFVNNTSIKAKGISRNMLSKDTRVLGGDEGVAESGKKMLFGFFLASVGLLAWALSLLAYILHKRRMLRRLETIIRGLPGKTIVSGVDGKVYFLHYYNYLHYYSNGKYFEELPVAVTTELEGKALRVIETGQSYSSNQELEGRFYHVDMVFLPKELYGMQAVLWQLNDVSEYVIAAKRARKNAQAKSNYLSMMSHELRTPLNAVIGFSELLRQSELNEEQRNGYINDIYAAAKSLLGLIDEAMDLSKLDEHRLVVKQEKTDLLVLCNDVVRMFEMDAKNKGLYLRTELPEYVPSVMIDALHLQQIISNLINNAVKFTDNGGVVLRMNYTDNLDNSVNLIFEVEDTGIGIRPEHKKRIFEPFEHINIDNALRTQKGTGLGLPIARGLARYIGGNISFVSEIDKGSTFTVTFNSVPLAGAADEQKEPTTEQKTSRGRIRKILLVDDTPLNLRVVSAMLKKFNLEVEEATSAAEAWEKLKTFLPDAVLTDYCMPDMPGDEMAQKIHCNPKFVDVKVVAVTADVECGQKSGDVFDDIIYKPVTIEKIKTLLAKL